MKQFLENYIRTTKLADEIEEIIDKISTIEKLESLDKPYKDTMYEYIQDSTNLSFEEKNPSWNNFVFNVFINTRLTNKYGNFFINTLLYIVGLFILTSMVYNYLDMPQNQNINIHRLLTHQLSGNTFLDRLLSMQLMKTLTLQIWVIALFILLSLKPILPYLLTYYHIKDSEQLSPIFTKSAKLLTFKDAFFFCLNFLIICFLFGAFFL